jgi:hypothetical protein
MDEAGHFQAPDAGVDCAPNELDLGRRRQDFRLALETVARADFDDRNVAW